jgi:hypothetical protein
VDRSGLHGLLALRCGARKRMRKLAYQSSSVTLNASWMRRRENDSTRQCRAHRALRGVDVALRLREVDVGRIILRES